LNSPCSNALFDRCGKLSGCVLSPGHLSCVTQPKVWALHKLKQPQRLRDSSKGYCVTQITYNMQLTAQKMRTGAPASAQNLCRRGAGVRAAVVAAARRARRSPTSDGEIHSDGSALGDEAQARKLAAADNLTACLLYLSAPPHHQGCSAARYNSLVKSPVQFDEYIEQQTLPCAPCCGDELLAQGTGSTPMSLSC
jgi:hypothetical protein